MKEARRWIVRLEGGEGGEEEFEGSLEDVWREAAEWARDGWNAVDRTFWVRVDVEGEDGHISRSKVPIDPEPPKCVSSEHEHDWQGPHRLVGGLEENPGVVGHGGGVRITRVCMHCGCKRVTDTFASDPVDGERGLESVRYEAGAFELDELEAED